MERWGAFAFAQCQKFRVLQLEISTLTNTGEGSCLNCSFKTLIDPAPVREIGFAHCSSWMDCRTFKCRFNPWSYLFWLWSSSKAFDGCYDLAIVIFWNDSKHEEIVRCGRQVFSDCAQLHEIKLHRVETSCLEGRCSPEVRYWSFTCQLQWLEQRPKLGLNCIRNFWELWQTEIWQRHFQSLNKSQKGWKWNDGIILILVHKVFPNSRIIVLTILNRFLKTRFIS